MVLVMKKLLLLLLLLPALAFGQELPDENWLCVGENATFVVDGKASSGDEVNLIFNPAYGARRFENDEWHYTNCREPFQLHYICHDPAAIMLAEDSVFVIGLLDKKFQEIKTATLVQFTYVLQGTCTKL